MRLAKWVGRATAMTGSSPRSLSQKPLQMGVDSINDAVSGRKGPGAVIVPPEVPGGTPLSLCDISRETDLFQIGAVEMSKQPIYFDDDFEFYLYGTFQESFRETNATLDLRIDCGSHCEEYGNPPGEVPSTTFEMDFCKVSYVQQPSEPDGKLGNYTCSPSHDGLGKITSPVYLLPMFIRVPGWYNFTFNAKTEDGDRIYCLTTEVCLRWKDPEKNKHYPEGPWSNCTWPR